MKLSILIPSNRPNELNRFMESARKNSTNFYDIEFIILVDDVRDYVVINNNVKTIHYPPTTPLHMGKLNERCYREAEGDWILLCNDDIVINTPGWDTILKERINQFPDEIALFYPDDGMFGAQLSCFPIVSRKVLELINFFPISYRRYKIDDTLFFIFPQERRIFIPEILFTHNNYEGINGYEFPDGRIYPIDRVAADYDNKIWEEQIGIRSEMKSKIHDSIYSKNETKILIGVPTAEYARRADFYDYYNILEKPEGTVSTFAHGQSPAKNRNLIIEQALENNCSHILFLDDDIAFKPNLLRQLFSHDKDIVTGLYLMRNYPHKPIIFDKVGNGGYCTYYSLDGQKSGLLEIVNCGLGCCLIKTEVFRKMQAPWITLGEVEKDMWCDDISFFNRARALGFKLFCDLDCLVGHFSSVTVWPNIVNGEWHTTYDSFGTGQISFPVVK